MLVEVLCPALAGINLRCQPTHGVNLVNLVNSVNPAVRSHPDDD